MTKMTNVKALEYVLTTCDLPEDVAAKLTNIKASLENKASNVNKKPTAQQMENERIKVELETILAGGDRFTATELQHKLSEAMEATYSNQRVSAVLRMLILNSKVEKTTEKGKTYFRAI